MFILLSSYCHPTVIYDYTPCPISSHVHHTLWIYQISEDMRCRGRLFCGRVKLLTAGYTTYSVNVVLSFESISITLFLVDEFKRAKKLKTFGMPRFVASGQHESGGVKYRFMVMDRFGSDLQKLFEQHGKKFPVKTVFTLAIQMVRAFFFLYFIYFFL